MPARIEAHGQEMAVHDVVTAPIGRHESVDLASYPLQGLTVVLTRPRLTRDRPEQARCEQPGQKIRPP